jgi:diguanylate cyclase (GGDEF)-like protein
VATDVTERQRAEQELIRRAAQDELTGLPNEREVARRISAVLDHDAVSAVRADVRNFDQVNETIGYQAGDQLLRRLGERLAADLDGAIVIGRTGGDEFAVAARGSDAFGVAARVRKSLEAAVGPDSSDEMAVDVRCGVAWMPAGGDAQQLLRRADAAVQLARKGTEAIVAWDETAVARRRGQLALARDLRRALDAREFSVVYQPIIDAASGNLHRVEALARWTSPGFADIGPDVFVPLAERLGRISQLTAHVLDVALGEIALRHGVPVSVNVSALDVMHGDLPRLVSQTLSAHGLSPESLTLELTETAALEATTEGLDELVRAGVQIAVDDFGRGWSSLELLKRLPARYLKLDRSYVAHVNSDRSDAAIVRAAVTLAHAFEMRVIAEGVETSEVLQAVRDLGCDLAQGYHIARPLGPSELADWLAQRRDL